MDCLLANMSRFFSEPLVSVIIVNWNYSRFVGQAIESVKGQTYSNIECFIVDNASSDDSIAVIKSAIKDDARFKLIQNTENLGHLGAGLVALDQAKGTLVGFLDADDYYFPDFIAFHIQVHLSSYRHTAVTSSGVLTIDGDNKAIGGNFRTIDKSSKRFTPNLPVRNPYHMSCVSSSQYQVLQEATTFGGWNIHHWFWTAGSSNVIQRDILNLLRPPKGTPVPMGGVDAYFLIASHALTGTTVIDLPLSAYRMHGENDYIRTP